MLDVNDSVRDCVPVEAEEGVLLEVAVPLGEATWLGVGVLPTLTT